MKFSKKEYDSIIVEINKRKFVSEDFIFTKRKGWMYIEHKASKNSFSFHRKKKSQIVDGNFQDRTFYLTNSNKKTEIEIWDNVKKEFSDWLKNLK